LASPGGREYEFQTDQSFTATDSIKLVKEYVFNNSQEITIFQSYGRVLQQWLYDKNTSSDAYTGMREASKSLAHTCQLTNIFNAHMDAERSLVDALSNRDEWMFLVTTPLMSRAITLVGVASAITLPLPELGDSIRANVTINLKRSMTGIVRTYVKKSPTNIISYSWILSYPQALALKTWYGDNNHGELEIYNWKGEKWSVKIVSNELTLDNVGKYQGRDYGKTEVSLQFEGTKLIG